MTREFDPACEDCNRLHMHLMWARGDLADLTRKARSPRAERSVFDRLADAKTLSAKCQVDFDAHVAEVHPDGFDEDPERRVKGVRRRRDGKKPCPLCGTYVVPGSGREHRSKRGDRCPGVRERKLKPVRAAELPPVVIPRLARPPVPHSDRAEDHYTAKKGQCRECGKWLPGERTLCGRCSVLRSA